MKVTFLVKYRVGQSYPPRGPGVTLALIGFALALIRLVHYKWPLILDQFELSFFLGNGTFV